MLNVSLTGVHRQRQAADDGLAEVLDVEQLVAVAAVADHREVALVERPVVEQREDAQPLRADERLGPQHGHDEARGAEPLGLRLGRDLRNPVRADAVQPVVLLQRMVIGNAVDGRRRDVDGALDAVVARGLEHDPRADDVGGVDVLGRIERQRRGAVHDVAAALQRGVHVAPNPDVALHHADVRLHVRVAERRDVERGRARTRARAGSGGG